MTVTSGLAVPRESLTGALFLGSKQGAFWFQVDEGLHLSKVEATDEVLY